MIIEHIKYVVGAIWCFNPVRVSLTCECSFAVTKASSITFFTSQRDLITSSWIRRDSHRVDHLETKSHTSSFFKSQNRSNISRSLHHYFTRCVPAIQSQRRDGKPRRLVARRERSCTCFHLPRLTPPCST